MRTVRSLLLFVLVLTVVTAGIGLWFISSKEETSPSGNAPNPSTPEGWQTYAGSESEFTFDYSAEAEVKNTDSGVTVSYLGPDNATGQITDGYSVTFRTPSLNGRSLEELAQEQKNNEDTPTSELLTQPTLKKARPGYRYITDEVNEAHSEVHILPTPESTDTALVIKGYVADPNDKGSRSQVQKIRASAWLPINFPTDAASPRISQVSLPLLDRSNSVIGVRRGCDTVVSQSFSVSPTHGDLTATYQKLFSRENEQPRTVSSEEGNINLFHMLGKDFEGSSSSLSFNAVTTEGGVARVRLSGEVNDYAGVCDHPRRRIQIEEAALQFPGIHTVHIFLNGEKSDLGPKNPGRG